MKYIGKDRSESISKLKSLLYFNHVVNKILHLDNIGNRGCEYISTDCIPIQKRCLLAQIVYVRTSLAVC